MGEELIMVAMMCVKGSAVRSTPEEVLPRLEEACVRSSLGGRALYET